MTDASTTVGASLRRWRERRRITQLQLSTLADVSSRHISFIETGRSAPTAAMVLRLARCLDVPLPAQNTLLLSAGFAPAHSTPRRTTPSTATINEAVERVLAAHLPYPALLVDSRWEMVAANEVVYALFGEASPTLLDPPINVLRLTLHPDGLAPRIANLPQWRGHILAKLQHDVAKTADPHLESLVEELRSYRAPPEPVDVSAPESALVMPLRLRTNEGVISMFTLTTVFGTPADVTVAEFAIESFYPEDEASAAYFHRLTQTPRMTA